SLEWAQGFVLPLTVQHLGVQLVQLAAVHVLALPPPQGEGVFRIGTAEYHRDDELVRAGLVVDPRESVGVRAERQHESCSPGPQSSRCPSQYARHCSQYRRAGCYAAPCVSVGFTRTPKK